jgi:hypothetical protein
MLIMMPPVKIEFITAPVPQPDRRMRRRLRMAREGTGLLAIIEHHFPNAALILLAR